MSSKKTNQQEDPEVQIEQALGKSEQFIEKNGKKMLMALCVVIVLIGGYFGYDNLIRTPKAENAKVAIFKAETAFGSGDYTLALNGNESFSGFLTVASQYPSTPAGNIANHYAGICYMKSGDYQSAITYLNKYQAVNNKEAGIVNAQNRGLIGDAYIQLKDNASAIKYYEMAIAASDNNLTTPYYLFKAGGVYLAEGNNAKALECYEKIKTNYYGSMEARDIDKYIGIAKK